jgi:ABC-type glycerol-3-phosphate transport system substrate-binding protein
MKKLAFAVAAVLLVAACSGDKKDDAAPAAAAPAAAAPATADTGKKMDSAMKKADTNTMKAPAKKP